MADKVQNITINYKVNTAEVERAKNLSQQAQQATDKFHQSAQQGATTTSQKLAGLTAEQKRLETAIKSTSLSNFATYKDYVKNLQGLSKQYSDVKIKVDMATKALKEQEKVTQQLSKSTQTTAQNTNFLANSLKAVFTVAAVKQAVSLSLEMAKLSGNVDGVSRAFNRAFPDAPLLLSNLTRATHGAVSEFELMQRTLQATNLGVAVESLPILFEFAATRAQQTGESVDYLVDSIVRGIGRKSILVLDNLGLSATRLREQFNGASLASQSVADVTRGVAEIARVELEKMGGFAETAATKVDQLSVSWGNLGKEISELATQDGGLIDFFKSYTDSFALLIEAQNKGISVTELATQKQREHNAEFSANLFFQTAFTKSKEDNIKVLDEEIQRLTRSIGAWASLKNEMEAQNREDQASIDIKRKSFPVRQEEIILLAQDIAFRNKIVASKREEILEDQEVLKLLLMRLAAMKEIVPIAEQLGLIAAKQAEIESVEDSLKAAKSTQSIHNLNIELEKLNAELADLKAFGTTRRQLIVEGELRLVPVVAPKGSSATAGAKSTDLSKQIQLSLDDAIKNIGPLAPSGQVDIIPMDDWDRIGQEFANNWQDILGTGLADTTNFLGAVIQAEADSYDARIAQSRQYYDRLMVLAGDNEKAKDRLRLREQKEENRLRREAFEADKRAKASTAAINGAAGIVNAFATLPYPAALVASVLIAAQTAAQIAVIQSQKPRFAKGVLNLQGPGTKTSDSIDAKLSKGESVMTADETRSSIGILKAVRAKTLNDKVLKDLKISATGVVYAGGMTDKGIIAKLDEVKNSIPDIAEKHGMLWKTKKKSENYRQWVRNKSF